MIRAERLQQLCRYIRAHHEAMIAYWTEIGQELVNVIEDIFGKKAIKDWYVGDYEDQYGVTIRVRLCSPKTYWDNRGKPGWKTLGSIIEEELKEWLNPPPPSDIRIYDEDLVRPERVPEVREKIRAWLQAKWTPRQEG